MWLGRPSNTNSVDTVYQAAKVRRNPTDTIWPVKWSNLSCDKKSAHELRGRMNAARSQRDEP